jgi:hypothetical protein
MPAFSFEKISPPLRHGTPPSVAEKPRGVIVQILDRLLDARAKRSRHEDTGVIARNTNKPPSK